MAGWIQVAGSIQNIYDTCVHEGEIYACGGNLLKWTGSEWIEVAPILESYFTYRIISFNGKIYGGTGTHAVAEYGGCLLEWNGVDSWSLVAPQYNYTQEYVSGLEIHDSGLWAGITAYNYGTRSLNLWNGADAWISKIDDAGIGKGVWGIKSYNSKIYGEGRYGELLQYNDVSAWIAVASRLNSQTVVRGLEEFDSELYVGTYPGGRLFKWNDSDAWVQVAASYYVGTHYVDQLKEFNSELYGTTSGGMGTLLKFTGSAWIEVADTLGAETQSAGLEIVGNDLYSGMSGGRLYQFLNRSFKLGISNLWKTGQIYLSLSGSWQSGQLYIALGGDATIESVKNETIESIKTETISYQKQSWRQ